MYETMMLSGQEYVDEYASKFKKNEPPKPEQRDGDGVEVTAAEARTGGGASSSGKTG
jgi:hypothetical protein